MGEGGHQELVIISNGGGKFHLAPLASAMSERGLLTTFITMIYPTKGLRRFVEKVGLTRYPELARMVQRGEVIPEERVVSLVAPELIYKLGMWMRPHPICKALSYRLNAISFRFYGRLAVAPVRRTAGKVPIYHYRAGMGHRSVAVAKQLGMIALCDHSIAHPVVLEYMVANRGAFPPPGYRRDVSIVEQAILDDINQADVVLVNSDFVKDTMAHQGWDPARVHVIYLGVDDQFLDKIPARAPAPQDSQEIRLMFAGGFQDRKGVDDLVTALMSISDVPWRISLATRVSAEMRRRYSRFLDDPRVTLLNFLSRAELARRMSEHDVLIFPSLAEGSARVVFEALACGCYVITTPNSGTIVRDGVHGALVPTGDTQGLEAAIRFALANGSLVREIGMRNSKLIQASYRQQQYGDAVEHLYRSLLEQRDNSGS